MFVQDTKKTSSPAPNCLKVKKGKKRQASRISGIEDGSEDTQRGKHVTHEIIGHAFQEAGETMVVAWNQRQRTKNRGLKLYI